MRWTSAHPNIVRLDTTVAAGAGATLRALTGGQTVLTATVTSGSEVAVVTVPVSVSHF